MLLLQHCKSHELHHSEMISHLLMCMTFTEKDEKV